MDLVSYHLFRAWLGYSEVVMTFNIKKAREMAARGIPTVDPYSHSATALYLALDRIAELETALRNMTNHRDEWLNIANKQTFNQKRIEELEKALIEMESKK